MIQNATQRLMQFTGRKVQLSEQEIAGLHASNAEEAELQVRSGLLMLEVAKAEKIEVQDSEVDADIERIVAGAGPNAERLRAAYANPEVRQSLKFRLLEDKVVELLLQHSKEKEMPKKSDEAK